MTVPFPDHQHQEILVQTSGPPRAIDSSGKDIQLRSGPTPDFLCQTHRDVIAPEGQVKDFHSKFGVEFAAVHHLVRLVQQARGCHRPVQRIDLGLHPVES